jgi:hypothetical protein
MAVGRHFSNMAAAKPEACISPVVGELETKFQMIFGDFQGRPTQCQWFRQRHVTADVTFATIAVYKPEVNLSPVVGELEAKFQMIFGGFKGCPSQRKWF